MNARTVLVAFLALICGASAVVGVNELTKASGLGGSDGTVPIVVASRDMPRGAMLSESALTIDHWPADSVPADALSDIKTATERSTMGALVKGEPILERKLASKDAGRGLAAQIPRGMRAFTIQTSHISAGVGGFLMPKDKVDVLLTTTTTGPTDLTGGGATTTLLQNVEVLAVAQRLDAPDTNVVDPTELKNVTLLVTPDQAAKLDLGMNKGTLHLTLRNPEDALEANTRPATMAQLRLHQEPPNQNLLSFGAMLVDAVAGAMAAPPAGETPVIARPATWSTQIHTMRGVHRGSVRVEIPR